MSKIGLMDKGSDQLDARSAVADTDRIPVFTSTGTEAQLMTVSQLSAGGVIDDNNTWTGTNDFTGGISIDGTDIDASAVELNTKTLNIKMTDVSTAGSIYVVSPFAGTYSKLYSVIDGAIATADAVITAEINGSAVTDGGLTIVNAGSAAGDSDTGTPSAANTVAVGDVIEIITNGASTNTVAAEFTIVITL